MRHAYIPVRSGGAVVDYAVVDILDLDLATGCRWSLNGSGYAFSTRGFMHRLILGDINPGNEVDHINTRKLDNRRCNLRQLSIRENRSRRYAANKEQEALVRAELIERLNGGERGITREQIAADYGLSQVRAARVARGIDLDHPNLIWSRDALAEWMLDFRAANGRDPKQRDMDGQNGAPWFTTVYRRFPGGFAEAREYAGLERGKYARRVYARKAAA